MITASLTSQTLEVSNWKALGELTNVDEFGRQYEVVRANNLSDGATRKAKGSYDNGSVPFELLFDSRDGGQVIMEEGLRTTQNYAFRIDVPPDTDGDGGPTYYLQALITSFRPRIGGPNDMTMMRGNLEIDHNDPVIVPELMITAYQIAQLAQFGCRDVAAGRLPPGRETWCGEHFPARSNPKNCR